MKNITVSDIVRVTGGKLLCGDPGQRIDHISIDSRSSEGNDLFVPIIGAKTDAHRFINDAFSIGCVATFTSEHDRMEDTHCWIRVEDTVKALQAVGRMCRSLTPVPAIGVTGSVGKTTTREMIATALSAEKRVFKTIKNYNTRITVPIMMAMLEPEDDIAVLELGMNTPGELAEIAEIARPFMAVITNIGVAHMEFYGSKEAICQEKLSVTKYLPENGMVLLNGDDPLLYAAKDTLPYTTYLYGTREDCDFRAVNLTSQAGCYRFDFRTDGKSIPVKLNALGRHNVLNAAAALGAALLCGVDLKKAAEALSAFTGFKSRLQVIPVKGFTVIDDTYNASPDSMAAGVEVLAGLSVTGRKTAVLGQMLELGPTSEQLHEEVGRRIARLPIDELIVVGEAAKSIGRGAAAAGCGYPVTEKEDKDQAALYLAENTKDGDAIYLKASNLVGLRDIAEYLKNR